MHAAVVTQEEEEREDLPANVTNSLHFHRGDVEQGLREADVVVEHTYRVAYVHQGYLETQNCVVAPELATGGVTTLDDIRRLVATGVAGCIIGRALYEGAFTVQEAVAALHSVEGRST